MKVTKVNLRVKENQTWISTKGKLYKVVGNSRTHAADIDVNGLLDSEVKCAKGDRYEANTESFFDQPAPPQRLACREHFDFQFVRAVHAQWVTLGTEQAVTTAAAPLVYSELTQRSYSIGIFKASFAFHDAAIASTAQLLGDENLDKFVSRDPSQKYKLVFNDAGVSALKSKQREAGIAASGHIDAATQALFLKELAGSAQQGQSSLSVVCGPRVGQLYCTTGGNDALRAENVKPLLSVPAIQF